MREQEHTVMVIGLRSGCQDPRWWATAVQPPAAVAAAAVATPMTVTPRACPSDSCSTHVSITSISRGELPVKPWFEKGAKDLPEPRPSPPVVVTGPAAVQTTS